MAGGSQPPNEAEPGGAREDGVAELNQRPPGCAGNGLMVLLLILVVAGLAAWALLREPDKPPTQLTPPPEKLPPQNPPTQR